MKEFNLEKAKNGAKVQTRDGREARIICFDRKHAKYPIIALVTESSGDEYIESFTKEGLAYIGAESAGDLVMAPAEIFVNVYLAKDGRTDTNGVFTSRESAEKEGKYYVENAGNATVQFITLRGEI